jgi:hypothetical protein
MILETYTEFGDTSYWDLRHNQIYHICTKAYGLKYAVLPGAVVWCAYCKEEAPELIKLAARIE